MILQPLDRQHHYIPVSPPPFPVAQEVFLAGLGQASQGLSAPPQGCFLLVVPAAVQASQPPQPGILVAGGATSPSSPHGECFYAVLGGRLAETFCTPLLKQQKGIIPAAASVEIARLLRQSQHSLEHGLGMDGCRGSALAYRLLMELVQANEEAPEKFSLAQRAIALMQENFAHLYGVEELAQALEVSKSHLIRVFSADVGMTPGQYLTQIRIERVKLVLQAGGYSYEAIAAMTGFSGANYLCKVFRKQTGMTPGEYLQVTGSRPQNTPESSKLQQLENILYL